MNHKSYKFRIYPNKTQANLIDQTCGMVRKYWNECVAAFNGYHKDYCPKPIYLTSKEFREKYEWAKGLSNQALSQKFRDFIGTKTQYFNKKRKTPLGRMKFKSKHRSRNSYRIDSRRFKIKEGKIRLEKIGWMKFDNHRQLPENAKFLPTNSDSLSVANSTVTVVVLRNIENLHFYKHFNDFPNGKSLRSLSYLNSDSCVLDIYSSIMISVKLYSTITTINPLF